MATRTQSWTLNQKSKAKQRNSLFHETLNWFHLPVSNQLKQYFAHSTLLLCCIKSHSHGLQPVVSASKSLGRESRVSDASDNALPLASLHYQPGLPRKTLVTRIYEGDGCVLSWHRKNLSLMWGTQVKWCQWGMWLTDIKRKCVFPKTAGAEYHIEALLPHCERGAPCFSHSISANPLTLTFGCLNLQLQTGTRPQFPKPAKQSLSTEP